MKGVLLFLGLIVGCYAFGQQSFDWALAAQGVSMNYVHIQSHPDSGFVALAEQSQIDMIRFKESVLRYSAGNTSEDERELHNQTGYVVLRLDDDGHVIWYRFLQSEVMGITGRSGGEVFLLIEIDGWFRKETYDDEDEEKENQPQFGIVEFSSDGRLEGMTPIKHLLEESRPEFDNFQLYEDDRFLLTGSIRGEKLASNLNASCHRGGGGFIMMVSDKGEPLWADIVSSRKNSCCAYAGEGKTLSVSPDGTIYFGGTYMIGGIFSTGLHTIAPANYSEYQKDAREAFVVAYKPNGKIKWVRTDKSWSRFQAIGATDEGVFVGHWIKGDVAFGEHVDTTARKQNMVTYINKKGKVKWSVGSMSSIDNMSAFGNQGVYLIGRAPRLASERRGFGTDTIPSTHDVFVSYIDPNGTASDIWSLDLWPSNEHMTLTATSDNQLIMSFEAWCGMSISLKALDKSLPELDCYGGVPILGRINRKD